MFLSAASLAAISRFFSRGEDDARFADLRKSAFTRGLLIAAATDGSRRNYDKARIMSIFYIRRLYSKARINYDARVANCELFQ